MSVAFSERACPSVCSDEAMEPAAKRARIEVKAFNQVDLETFTLKNNGKNTNGNKSGLNTFPLIGNQPIRFNMTPSDWFQAPFVASTSAASTRILHSLAGLLRRSLVL